MLKKIRQDRPVFDRGDCLVETTSQSTNRGRTCCRDSRKDKGLRPSYCLDLNNCGGQNNHLNKSSKQNRQNHNMGYSTQYGTTKGNTEDT